MNLLERMSPEYEHDCEHCKYIATVAIIGRIVDIYKNCSSMIPDGYIIRYSSEGSDYSTSYKHSQKNISGYNQGVVLSLNYDLCVMVEEQAVKLSNSPERA
jgi:hypothetical protein